MCFELFVICNSKKGKTRIFICVSERERGRERGKRIYLKGKEKKKCRLLLPRALVDMLREEVSHSLRQHDRPPATHQTPMIADAGFLLREK